MPREINYTANYDCGAAREAAALQDLIDWLGEDKYAKLRSDVLAVKPRGYTQAKAVVGSVRFSLGMFAGVSGYPVTCFLRSVFAEWKQ